MGNMQVCARLRWQYAERMEDDGYDDLPYLLGLDESELQHVAEQVGMKPGHVAKFVAWMPKYVHG